VIDTTRVRDVARRLSDRRRGGPELSSNLAEMNDAKDMAIEIVLGNKANAASVAVTDVLSDGKTITVSYAVTPARRGSGERAYSLVRFPRQDGIRPSITNVKFVAVARSRRRGFRSRRSSRDPPDPTSRPGW